MTNILYFPTRYFPAISGAEFYLQRMAEILKSKYYYKVDIYTSNAVDFRALRDPSGKNLNDDNKYYTNVNGLNITRYQINYNKSITEKLTEIKNLHEFKTLNISDNCLIKIIQNGPFLEEMIDKIKNHSIPDYDLIHTTFFPYFNLLIGLLIGKQIKKPTICTPFFHFSNPRYLDNYLIEILKSYDLIIACTNIEKKNLIERCGLNKEKIKIIPMGVDFGKFSEDHISSYNYFNFKKTFLKKEKKFYMVLFCGYKNYEKGAISILKAIPYIIKKIKKVYFVFIGPSTKAFNRESSKIKKIDNVRILNFTPENLTGYYDKKKISAFKEADIYLMPSRSDAFGISFLEAWSSGKPVIGANIGATPDVIRNNEDGLLAEFDNPIDIGDKVIKLLKNKRLRKQMGNQGKEKVMRNYTWNIIAKQTHETYNELVKNYVDKK